MDTELHTWYETQSRGESATRRSCITQEWGWVLEMYGFAISCFKEDVGPIDLHLKMMSQPPWDEKLSPYYLLHYTYGNDYTLEGVFTPGKIGAWRFDKRSYSEKPPPRSLGPPPDGMKNELVRSYFTACIQLVHVCVHAVGLLCVLACSYVHVYIADLQYALLHAISALACISVETLDRNWDVIVLACVAYDFAVCHS